MPKYAIYKMFDNCTPPNNLCGAGGYMKGVLVGTSQDNPMIEYNDNIVHCPDCEFYQPAAFSGKAHCLWFEHDLYSDNAYCYYGRAK